MDESASNIVFDAHGICNFCAAFAGGLSEPHRVTADPQALGRIVEDIYTAGRGKPYDCVVGVSGGVDSAYVLHLVKQQGLRPLAVHLDNGWNSELAVANINALVDELKVDLYTHVIDWNENRDLQLSMLKAGVIDIELLMDNAMLALNYQCAARYGLRHVISGSNQATEGIRMPVGWNHFKLDALNIRAIHQRFGAVPIRTHPLVGTLGHLWYKYYHRIEWLSWLDYVHYDKNTATTQLIQLYGFRPYPYKHYESVFTRFYQGHILPTKFGVDKRRVHLSTLIISGQLSRTDALAKLAHPPYDLVDLQRDYQFVLKKFGVDAAWFESYLLAANHPHADYPSELPRWQRWLTLWSRVKAMRG